MIRSLPLADGYRAILPLFSEVDEDTEMDSVSVIGRALTPSGALAWRVRFADPAIIVTYEIDAATRQPLSESVAQRRSGRTMRYVRVACLEPHTPGGSRNTLSCG